MIEATTATEEGWDRGTDDFMLFPAIRDAIQATTTLALLCAPFNFAFSAASRLAISDCKCSIFKCCSHESAHTFGCEVLEARYRMYGPSQASSQQWL